MTRINILKRRPALKLGDVYLIHLDDNKHSYGQYIYTDWRGPVVRVFNLVTEEKYQIKDIVSANLMFQPVRFGLGYALKKGFWEKIGTSDISSLPTPKFRVGNKSFISNKVQEWFLVDGGKVVSLGENIPMEYRHLERDMVWSAEDLAERIKLGGKIPYPAWDY